MILLFAGAATGCGVNTCQNDPIDIAITVSFGICILAMWFAIAWYGAKR